jgi:hypothetical protein
MSFPLISLQRAALRAALMNRLVVMCFGAGVDSTAMLVALRLAGRRPDAITFADTGGEKPPTLAHITRIEHVLRAWDWPPVEICRKLTQPGTPYDDLQGNCLANETLPSLVSGRKGLKSCRIKWKQQPQDQHLMGVARGPNAKSAHPLWRHALARGQRIVKLIGYDCGRADLRRSRAAAGAGIHGAGHFEDVYVYALERLSQRGAPGRRPGESGAAYIRRLQDDGWLRPVRHPGNHVFTWCSDGAA